VTDTRPASLDDPRLTVMGLFAEAFTGVAAKLTAQLSMLGLAGAEFEALLRLARSPHGRLRMTDLTAQTSLTSSGITRVVDRLVDRGLVCREACPTDRRSTYAVITGAGQQLIDAALPGHLELVERWLLGPLDAEQRGALEAALRRVRDAVQPQATAGADGAGFPDGLPEPAGAGSAG
jgi:MarR family transcriptional regulator, 2-MHQ and catechol-resistance regulon repressor